MKIQNRSKHELDVNYRIPIRRGYERMTQIILKDLEIVIDDVLEERK